MKKIIFVFSVLGLFITGCASSNGISLYGETPVNYDFTTTHFMYPETNGSLWSGKAQMGLSGVSSVELVNDMDDNTYTTKPKVDEGLGLALQLDLGLFPWVDLIYVGGIGVRVQLMGSPMDEAKAGDYSLSVAYINKSGTSEYTHEDTTGSVKKAEAEVDATASTYLVSFGRRKSDRMLLYTSLFYTDADVDSVNLYQTNNTNFTFDQEVTAGSGSSYGVSLGFYFETPSRDRPVRFNCGAEIAYAKTEWKQNFNGLKEKDDDDGLSFGGYAGIAW